MIRKILLCIDDQSHTEKAMDYALQIAGAAKAKLIVFHVMDRYILKRRFVGEIFASGRQTYIDYAEGALVDLAIEVKSRFEEMAEGSSADYEVKLSEGEPVAEILKEAEGGYDLVIVGGKDRKGIKRIVTEKIPERLLDKLSIPVLVVK